MDNISPFNKPKSAKLPEKQMVRIIDITSPFFNWEGWIQEILEIKDAQDIPHKFVQVIFAHSGFQFPVLTFHVNQTRIIK